MYIPILQVWNFPANMYELLAGIAEKKEPEHAVESLHEAVRLDHLVCDFFFARSLQQCHADYYGQAAF